MNAYSVFWPWKVNRLTRVFESPTGTRLSNPALIQLIFANYLLERGAVDIEPRRRRLAVPLVTFKRGFDDSPLWTLQDGLRRHQASASVLVRLLAPLRILLLSGLSASFHRTIFWLISEAR